MPTTTASMTPLAINEQVRSLVANLEEVVKNQQGKHTFTNTPQNAARQHKRPASSPSSARHNRTAELVAGIPSLIDTRSPKDQGRSAATSNTHNSKHHDQIQQLVQTYSQMHAQLQRRVSEDGRSSSLTRGQQTSQPPNPQAPLSSNPSAPMVSGRSASTGRTTLQAHSTILSLSTLPSASKLLDQPLATPVPATAKYKDSKLEEAQTFLDRLNQPSAAVPTSRPPVVEQHIPRLSQTAQQSSYFPDDLIARARALGKSSRDTSIPGAKGTATVPGPAQSPFAVSPHILNTDHIFTEMHAKQVSKKLEQKSKETELAKQQNIELSRQNQQLRSENQSLHDRWKQQQFVRKELNRPCEDCLAFERTAKHWQQKYTALETALHQVEQKRQETDGKLQKYAEQIQSIQSTHGRELEWERSRSLKELRAYEKALHEVYQEAGQQPPQECGTKQLAEQLKQLVSELKIAVRKAHERAQDAEREKEHVAALLKHAHQRTEEFQERASTLTLHKARLETDLANERSSLVQAQQIGDAAKRQIEATHKQVQAEVQQAIAAKDADLERLRALVGTLEHKVQQSRGLQEECEYLKSEVASMQQRMQQKSSSWQAELDTVKAAKDQQDRQLQLLEAEVARLQRELTQAQADAARTHTVAHMQQQGREQHTHELHEQLAAVRADCLALEQHNGKLVLELEKAKKRESEMQAALNFARSQLQQTIDEKLKWQHDTIHEQHKLHDEKKVLEQQIETLESSNNELAASRVMFESQLDALRKQAQAAKDTEVQAINLLSERTDELSRCKFELARLSQASALIAELEGKLHQLQAALLQAQEREAATHNRLHVVEGQLAEAKDAAECQQRRFEEQIAALQDDIVKARQDVEAATAQAAEADARTAAAEISFQTQLQEQQQAAQAELASRLQTMNEQLDAVTAHHEAMAESYQAQLQQLESQYQELRSEKAQVEEELGQVQAAFHSAQYEKHELQNDIAALQQLVAKKDQEMDSVLAQYNGLVDEYNELHAQHQQKESELSVKQDAVDSLRKQLNTLNQQVAQQQDKIQELEEETIRIDGLKEQAAARMYRLRDYIKSSAIPLPPWWSG